MSVSLLTLTLLLSGCATSGPVATETVDEVLDRFHAAAAQADEKTYFGSFAPYGVFLGTDPGERWTLDEFKAWAAPYFARESAWTFQPSARRITYAPNGMSAWFDEVVSNAKYGDCRGTGVVVREGTTWKIAQYSLSIPIPNDLAGGIVDRIRRRK